MLIVVFEPNPITFLCLVLNLIRNDVKVFNLEDFHRNRDTLATTREQYFMHYSSLPHYPAGVLAINAGLGDSPGSFDLLYTLENSQKSAISFDSLSENSVSGGDSLKASIHRLESDASLNHAAKVEELTRLRRRRVPVIDLNILLDELHVAHELIELMKVDCEGCEFRLYPAIRNLLVAPLSLLESSRDGGGGGTVDVPRPQVKSLVGELHWALMNNKTKTMAPKPSVKELGG